MTLAKSPRLRRFHTKFFPILSLLIVTGLLLFVQAGRASSPVTVWFYTYTYDTNGNPTPITATITAYGSLLTNGVNGNYPVVGASRTNSSGLGSISVPADQYLYFNITDGFMAFYPNDTTAANNPNVQYSGSATSYVILGSNINEGLTQRSPIRIDPNAKIYITSTTPNPVTANGWVKVINGDQDPSHYFVNVSWGDGQSTAPLSLTTPIIASKSFTANWTAGPHTYSTGTFTLTAKLYHQQPGGKAYTVEASTLISLPSFTLSITNAPSGVPTTIPGSGLYVTGSQVTLAAPDPVNIDSSNRYRFDHWTVDASTVPGNPITVTMNANHNAVANYVRQYLLTVNNGGHGTASGQNWYDTGSTATFSISPTTVPGTAGTQYVYTAWSGDSSATTASASINMNGPKTVTAQWKTQYYLTFNGNPAGIITLPSTGWYDSASSVQSTAPPFATNNNIQYEFANWTTNGSPITNHQLSLTVNGPSTTTAYYIQAVTPDLAVSRSPEPVTYTDTPSFSASAFSKVGINQVILSYSLDNGPFKNVTMTLANNLYSASLYPMRYGTMVTFKVYALDINGLATLYTSTFTVTDKLPPSITNIAWTPVTPASGQSVEVTALLTEPVNASGVDGVYLYYRVNSGTFIKVPMQFNSLTGKYFATIPGQAVNSPTSVFASILPEAYAASSSTVDLYIVGTDLAGNQATTQTYSYNVSTATGTPILPSGLLPLLLLLTLSAYVVQRRRRE